MKTSSFKNILLSIAVFAILLMTFSENSLSVAYGNQNEKIVILHTNDVHCAVDQARDDMGNVTKQGYSALTAYKKSQEDVYGKGQVLLVDAGDSIQGSAIGLLSKGAWIIDIMNSIGYVAATPGNHEFDFGFDNFQRIKEISKFKWISSNMARTSDGSLVLPAYCIKQVGDTKIAFVGISTPESLTKSTPAFFQDMNGKFLYTFGEDESGEGLYKSVQAAINGAKAEGAQYVIALGHLGENGITSQWRGSSVISHTEGINILIDGHSHEVLEEYIPDIKGKEVLRVQTGTGLASIGKIVIDTEQHTIRHEFVKEYGNQDSKELKFIKQIEDQYKATVGEEVGSAQFDLTTKDTANGNRRIRSGETNLGDFCADTFRKILQADIGIINGGGIRADLQKGKITVNDLLSVYPYGNNVCTIQASGKTIQEALELSAKNYPEESGGFLQVSGLSYTIDQAVPSSVHINEKGEFVNVEGPGRIRNIYVNGEALDPERLYTIAGTDYILRQGGDGYTMFRNCSVISMSKLEDFECLKKYIEQLQNKIGAEYQNPEGAARITILGY